MHDTKHPPHLELVSVQEQSPGTREGPPSLPQRLREWAIHEPIPSDISRFQMTELVARFEASLSPVDAMGMAVLLAPIMDMAAAFNIAVPNKNLLTNIYFDTLGDVPPDLFDLAVKRTVRSWGWGNRLPLPAEIRVHIQTDLDQRRRDLSRAKLAALRAPADAPRPRDAVSQAEGLAAFADIKRAIAGALNVVPLHPDEKTERDVMRDAGDMVVPE